MEDNKRNRPNKDRNAFHKQASEILGEEFWQEIAGLIPNTGPRIDMYHTGSAVIVLAELPGLESLDEIRISIEGHTLVLEGEIPCLYPVSDSRISLNERFFGGFRRALSMPGPVSTDGIHAKYSRGLLIIELPIKQDAQQQSIPVDILDM
ncbi:Hsp20/alpha crystallin family protein [Paenibacillus filicis]|uniref:Hsp20/alpha crystallin family protein n=1 Tax=Paenibacillus gyeongsangnamensis TaxID=3388067 RepID=A0ABT4Q2H2_9BACL|nr:Hsp20/alpha crystallin family protein [Paenibacillus filicis]MCZ8511003.1 Hsp20/alpha crystallin family protein [Paenibacillus filicis]